MKKLYPLILICIININSFAQQNKADSSKLIKGNVAAPVEQTFTVTEVQAVFPGGKDAWDTYLTTNLNSEIASNNHAPKGKYKISASFIIDKDGNVTDVSISNNPGYGTGEEVIRVLNKSPKWTPGLQNGRFVKSWRTQNITFNVEEESSSNTVTEVQAVFPGGQDAWTAYLKDNIEINVASRNHAPVGKYIVKASYLVDKDGKVTDVSVTNPGYGTAEEVKRVIENSPKWTPGLQNGRFVKSWRTQNITFNVEVEGSSKESSLKESFSNDSIDEIEPPEYPNTIEAWKAYLTHNIDFDVAAKHRAPLGQYEVRIKFNIDEKGRVVDVVAENDPGYGTAEEAIRVIKNSRKWIPATRNGVPFKAPYRQGFSFLVTESNRRSLY